MLISFLERGNTLGTLHPDQMFEIEIQFTLYLLKAITFREAMRRCESILDPDQEHLKFPIKEKLSEMIEDPDCNTRFKPAILRLANGDRRPFDIMDAPVKRTLKVLKTSPNAVKRRIEASVFPISKIGPRHLSSLEMEHLNIVTPHAKRYVVMHARFLASGDSGVTVDDMVRDLTILALRAMRWYYPFLSGLHMSNTMRRTITNRGRGMVKYATAGLRQRLIQNEDGQTINRESGVEFDSASNSQNYAINPAGEHALRFFLSQLKAGDSVLAKVANFVMDEEAQERFCNWAERNYSSCQGAQGVPEIIRQSGVKYPRLLSGFLDLPRHDVADAIRQIRTIVR